MAYVVNLAKLQAGKPTSVNVCGIEYAITYVDNPAEVDIHKRESLWGQCDYWTRTIRVYVYDGQPAGDVWETIIHEVLHAIEGHLHIRAFADKHEELSVLSVALTDTLIRNGWLEAGDGREGKP